LVIDGAGIEELVAGIAAALEDCSGARG
jgi:hypothetical protein